MLIKTTDCNGLDTTIIENGTKVDFAARKDIKKVKIYDDAHYERTEKLCASDIVLPAELEKCEISLRFKDGASFDFQDFRSMKELSFRFAENPVVSAWPPYVESINMAQTLNKGGVFDFSDCEKLKHLDLSFTKGLDGIKFPPHFDGNVRQTLYGIDMAKGAFLDFSACESKKFNFHGLDLRKVKKIKFPDNAEEIYLNCTYFPDNMILDLSNLKNLKVLEGYTPNIHYRRQKNASIYKRQFAKIVLSGDIDTKVLQQIRDYFDDKDTTIMVASKKNLTFLNMYQKVYSRGRE